MTSKSKNSESFYITMSYVNHNGKSTSKIFRKLGTLEELSKSLNTDRDGVMAWAKAEAEKDTLEFEKRNERITISYSPLSRIPLNDKRSFFGGYLFLQKIYYKTKIHNICRNITNHHKFDFNLNDILSDLIYTRILSPSSKRSSFETAQSFLEKPNYELHDIYRALSILASECDYIQSELYRNSNFTKTRNKSILYYDCTNYYFEIEQEEGSKKYGKSKENRPNPIIQMGLFMDADGIPIAFDLFDGNQNEQPSMKPLEQKIIEDFDLSKFVVCTDAGLASKANKRFNGINGRAFITTQSLKKLKKEIRETALNPTQWRLIGNSTFVDISKLDENNEDVLKLVYYKEIPFDSDGPDHRLIITYSPKYKKYQEKIREEQIKRALKMIESGKAKKNSKNPNDPARFINKCACTENGEIANDLILSLDEEAILKEKMYDGFYAVCTNLEDDVSAILKVSERRWEIEECFRIMKTEFDARPVYVSRDDRIKAHFLICFISLIIYRLLEKELKNQYTVSEILSSLKSIYFYNAEGQGYVPIYTRTKITDSLHDVCGFYTDKEFISKSTMREIIKLSKSS